MQQFLENQFFGRKPVLNLLKKRVLDLKEGYRQNVAFLGHRFVGKTAVLHKFMSEIDEPDLVVIYLDLDNKDGNYFFSNFIGCLLYNYSKSQNLPLFNDLALLIENARKHIPQTIEAIQKIRSELTKDKWDQAYRNLMDLPDIFTAETGKFCVIILDEFQNLEELGFTDVYQELGKKIMTQKRSIYIVASSVPSLAKKILSEKLSLLFGNFEIIDLGPLEMISSQVLIEHHLKGIKIGGQLKNFLLDLTAGHPLYLAQILKELVNLSIVHKQSEIFLPVLVQGLENVIFDPWGVLSRHFEIIMNQLCQNKNNRAMSSVLLALANGKNRLRELSEDAGLKPSLLIQRINRLIDAGIIIRNGNSYHFQDKLLKYWVKFVFQKRIRSFEMDTSKQKQDFREEVARLMTNFQMIAQRDLPSRITELLNCFDNESFQLNGRKYKLPLFHEVLPVDLKKGALHDFNILQARSSEGVWLIVLKEASLCENDVNVFLSETKNFEQKPQRRVLISLSDLDENVRVKALQERMWIWNEPEINALLNFYDKPFIVK